MKRITIDLPETAFSGLRKSPEEFVREMRIEAATQWYAQGRVSQEKGAEVAGLTRAEFIDELARREIAVDQVTLEELREEVEGV